QLQMCKSLPAGPSHPCSSHRRLHQEIPLKRYQRLCLSVLFSRRLLQLMLFYSGYILLIFSGKLRIDAIYFHSYNGFRFICQGDMRKNFFTALRKRKRVDLSFPTADGREIWNRYACHSRGRHKYEINLKSGGGHGNEVSGKRRLHGRAYYEESQDIAV